jgi:uncharacterized membrane protein
MAQQQMDPPRLSFRAQDGNGSAARNGDGTRDTRVGRGLGWFSIGLGLAEIAAPQAVARMIGVPAKTSVLRMVGVREILTGVGLLTQPEAPGWRWARVVGDVMDLALLGTSARQDGSDSRKTATASMAVLGITAVDIAAGVSAASRNGEDGQEEERPKKAILTIDRSPEECYRAWTDPAVLNRVMTGIESVRYMDGKRSHWVMRSPNGDSVEWDSEITEDVPNRRLAWRSVPGSEFQSSGAVTFDAAPGGRGTIVRMETKVESGGPLVARILGAMKGHNDLLRFKQLLETGTIPKTEGQPSGRRSFLGKIAQKGEK